MRFLFRLDLSLHADVGIFFFLNFGLCNQTRPAETRASRQVRASHCHRLTAQSQTVTHTQALPLLAKGRENVRSALAPLRNDREVNMLFCLVSS